MSFSVIQVSLVKPVTTIGKVLNFKDLTVLKKTKHKD